MENKKLNSSMKNHNLVISKVIHFGLVTNVPHTIIDQLNVIQKRLHLESKTPNN